MTAWPLALGVLGTAVLTMITPLVASNTPLLIAVRPLKQRGHCPMRSGTPYQNTVALTKTDHTSRATEGGGAAETGKDRGRGSGAEKRGGMGQEQSVRGERRPHRSPRSAHGLSSNHMARITSDCD